MAAFALGLLADPSARPALLKALDDPEPIVQGRAAEALGSIGDRADADAIGAMVRRHVGAGVLANIESDDLTYPLDAAGRGRPPRGLCADTAAGVRRAGRFRFSIPQGQPVSRWWPFAYALQRVGDPRAAPVLLTLLDTPGRYTASFAITGSRGYEGDAGGERAAGDRRRAQARSRDRDPVAASVDHAWRPGGQCRS